MLYPLFWLLSSSLKAPAEVWTTVRFAAVLGIIAVGCIQSLNGTAGSDILTSTTLMGMALGFMLAGAYVAVVPAGVPAFGVVRNGAFN